MPIKKSAKKALKQSKVRASRNLARKTEMKELIKKIEVLVKDGKTKEAQELLPKAYKSIDKAAKTGILKKNTAARKKSRITKLCQAKNVEK